jgi:pyruvate dehydrogenase E1 component alpha subunit
MKTLELDGSDAETVWNESKTIIEGIRSGGGPAFLLATCYRPQGHFLGDPLLRIRDNPIKELSQLSGPLMKSVTRLKGSTLKERLGSLKKVSSLVGKTVISRYSRDNDPVGLMRTKAEQYAGLEELEKEVNEEIEKVVESVLNIYEEGTGQ